MRNLLILYTYFQPQNPFDGLVFLQLHPVDLEKMSGTMEKRTQLIHNWFHLFPTTETFWGAIIDPLFFFLKFHLSRF